MRMEKTYWYDHKPKDNNKGFIYGINYIHNNEIIDCEWYKTTQAREEAIQENIEKDKGVLIDY